MTRAERVRAMLKSAKASILDTHSMEDHVVAIIDLADAIEEIAREVFGDAYLSENSE